MSHSNPPTDEDRQIERLIIHRNLVQWIVQALSEEKIVAVRTTGNDEGGDICIVQLMDVPRAKAKLRDIQRILNGGSFTPQPQTGEANYIEVKAYCATTVTSTLARKLIQKATVMGVVTTGTMTKPAKALLDEADIAWIEKFPEDELYQREGEA